MCMSVMCLSRFRFVFLQCRSRCVYKFQVCVLVVMCMSVMCLSRFRFVFLQCRSRCVYQISDLCSCSDVYVSDVSVSFQICVLAV